MNQVVNSDQNDDLRSEYDFSGEVRGKHYDAYRKGTIEPISRTSHSNR